MKSVFISLVAWTMWNSPVHSAEIVDASQIQVRFVLPFGLDLSPKAGWLEVLSCTPECNQVITQIPLSEVRSASPLEIEFKENGVMILKQTLNGSGNEAIWARQTLSKEGWYQPVELCTWPDAPTPCVYEVRRDESTQSLELQLRLLDPEVK